MNSVLFNQIKNRIIGLQLVETFRICNMLELDFTAPNAPYEVFHVETAFRFMQRDAIITTDLDLYIPFDENNENFRYDVGHEKSMFDFKVSQLNIQNKVFTVKNIEFSRFGDVRIELSAGNDDLEIEFFNEAREADDDECWRFFSLHTDSPHIVCYRNEVKK